MPDGQNGVPAGWRERATVSVREYAAILRISPQTAYDAVKAGEVPAIRIRGRILVSVPALLRQLEGGANTASGADSRARA